MLPAAVRCGTKRTLLLTVILFTILPPERQPLLLEEREDDLVPILAILEVLGLESGFFPIAALLAIALAATVKSQGHRDDLAQIQGVEGIVEERHLGIRSVAFAPE